MEKDCTITIYPQRITLTAKQGETILQAIARQGIDFFAPCGGKGTCGKCKVKLLQGEVLGETPNADGMVSSCKAIIKQDISIELELQSGGGIDSFQTQSFTGEKEGFGVILDVGTTTLAACLVDLGTGEVVRKASSLNPQGVYGADVLSRINACREGKLELLQKVVIEKSNELIELIAKDNSIDELIVSANTTMLHVFLGVNPETIGVYPFTPVFTKTQNVDGAAIGLKANKVRLLPSVSGYIGGDITAGTLACSMQDSNKTELLVDIGTNGEVVLSHEGRLYATSTAAGPALEGACIECGVGGVSGAIDKVYLQNGKLEFSTIGNEKARGICGSGLIDLIAVLLEESLIDESGGWNEESCSPLIKNLIEDKFYLTGDVYLSQRDIRQFQLAKSAIVAGIEALLSTCGVAIEDVANLYVAGGLGFYMNLQNAGRTGLLPKWSISKAKVVGNTSLAGARLCLLQETAQREIERIATETQVIELSFSKVFQDLYIEYMSF